MTEISGIQITGFILSLLAFLTSYFGIVPTALSIAGLVLSIKSMKDKKRGMAITGIVLSTIALMSGLFWTLMWIIAFASI